MRVTILLIIITLLAGCKTPASYKDIHYGLYWHKSPYSGITSQQINTVDFIHKHKMKWGSSIKNINETLWGWGADSIFRKSGMLEEVCLFPEIKTLKIKRKETQFADIGKRGEMFEEADIFSNGEMYFYNDKLYEIVFTHSTYNTYFTVSKNSVEKLKISKEDPAKHGIYHIYEYMKIILSTKYGKPEEKIQYNLQPELQKYFTTQEEIGRDLFSSWGHCFREAIWTNGDTEIRLIYSGYGYGTIKLHYWNPDLRRQVAYLEQERIKKYTDKHF